MNQKSFRQRQRRSSNSVHFEKMEPRNLLAGIQFDAGVITVTGTNTADSVRVVSSTPDQLSVTFYGHEQRDFSSQDVQEIVFLGLDGNDWFKNETDVPSRAYGHSGEDSLVGGSANDRLRGGPGNDVIYGGDGDDLIKGDQGDDFANGQNGADRIFGQVGQDRLFGQAGPDVIVGGHSNDFLVGGTGDDTILGNGGNDDIYAQEGDDWVSGGEDDDTIHGNQGRDRIRGDAGSDRIWGGADDDNLSGGEGDDFAYGQSGNDRLTGDDGNDHLNGGDGDDRGNGGSGDDSLVGQDGNDILHGDQGRDRIFGQLGNDLLFGGDGADELFGNQGRDHLVGGNDDDTILGNEDNDEIYGQDGNDNLYGGSQDDLIRGGSGRDSLFGQHGNDDLSGQDDDDDLEGGIGEDRLHGGLGNDDYDDDENDDLFDDNEDYSANGDFEIKGFIENLDTDLQTFTTLGITVNYAQAEISHVLADGQFVEVEGSFDGNTIQADEVELEDDQDGENFEARGDIVNLNTSAMTFEFLGFTVDYSSASIEGLIEEGQFVEVEGHLNGTHIVATEVEVEDQNDDGDQNDNRSEGEVELRGELANLDLTSQTFTILGVLVDFANADLFVELRNGIMIKVDGTMNGSTLVADEVQAEEQGDDRDRNFEASGSIQNLDTQNLTFELLGFTVDYSNADIRRGLADDVVVEIEGWFDGDFVMAERIR